MSAILNLISKKKKEQLRFSEENYLNCTHTHTHTPNPILHVATTFSLKQGETRISHGPIPHPLNTLLLCRLLWRFRFWPNINDATSTFARFYLTIHCCNYKWKNEYFQHLFDYWIWAFSFRRGCKILWILETTDPCSGICFAKAIH